MPVSRTTRAGAQLPNRAYGESFTIIVGKANELVKPIRDQMPATLERGSYQAWISGEGGKELRQPYPTAQMKAQPISTRINNPENDDPS